MSVAARNSRRTASPTRRLLRLSDHLDPVHASGRLPALVIVILTGVMLWAFLFSNDFRVETVAVRGAEFSDVDELVTRSQALDQSVFRVRSEDIAASIEALPAVQSATVEVRYPGQVTISVIERQPVLVLELGDGFALVSDDGVTISPHNIEGLPTLRIEGLENPSTFEAPPELVAAVRAISGFYGANVHLIWTRSIGLTIELPDERIVLIGQPDEIEAKLTVLSAIESQVGSSWSQLDLRAPSRPAYR